VGRAIERRIGSVSLMIDSYIVVLAAFRERQEAAIKQYDWNSSFLRRLNDGQVRFVFPGREL
jgi:hypothetical protein